MNEPRQALYAARSMDVIGRDRVCKILMSSSAPSLDGQWAAHCNAENIPVQTVLC